MSRLVLRPFTRANLDDRNFREDELVSKPEDNVPVFLFLGTKLLQAQRFNDPNNLCKIMVATDAIGMGLNLYVINILSASLKSFYFCLILF